MSVDKLRDWKKHPWSFMSSRYGPVADDKMIEEHGASDEFQLEQPRSIRANPNLGAQFFAPSVVRCPMCRSTDVRVDSPSGVFPEHVRCSNCGEDWDL